MKNRIYLLTAALCITFGAATTLMAHHSPSAIFDMKKKVPMKGTLTKVDWVNPHIVMFLDVKGDDGNDYRLIEDKQIGAVIEVKE